MALVVISIGAIAGFVLGLVGWVAFDWSVLAAIGCYVGFGFGLPLAVVLLHPVFQTPHDPLHASAEHEDPKLRRVH